MDSESASNRKSDDFADKAQDLSAAPSPNPSQAFSAAAGANPRVEVSAQTIARMMGIASSTDLQLLEGRLDLLASRVSTLMMKVDKVLAGLGALASAGDIGRLETQVASMKSILREAVESIGAAQEAPKSGDRDNVEAQSRKLKEGIRSSTDSQ
jgi:hypothetical protein